VVRAVTDAVRVGVIGTGFGAQVVAPAFDATPGCDVVEVVTPRDEAAVAALCARSDVDLVSVHSPPFLHLDHVRKAVAAGHAVLCDKPFGRNAEESAEMVDVARAAGVVGLLNFERRFDPAREQLRDLLLAGAIGRPYHFQYSRFIALPEPRRYGWLSEPGLGGGWLGGQGSHLIDAVRWLFGEVAQAAAVMRTPTTHRLDASGELRASIAEDGFTAILRTESGVTSVIDAEIESPVAMPERLVVLGTGGLLEVGDDRVTRTTASGDVEIVTVDLGGRPSLLVAMQRWASVVCEAVRTGTVAAGSPTFADGLACAQVMDRMRPGPAG
jgi:predicted dehydrogenase